MKPDGGIKGKAKEQNVAVMLGSSRVLQSTFLGIDKGLHVRKRQKMSLKRRKQSLIF